MEDERSEVDRSIAPQIRSGSQSLDGKQGLLYM